MKKLSMVMVAAALTLMTSAAFAQNNRGAQTDANGARTQEFNFTDELVQGQLVRPDGETSRVRRRSAGISLIRIREHFVPEMLKSVENL
ncbi:MAG: hypothetical protein JNK72_07955 [Myxococcales bacterium]|nr:hypothetical protein [Myxococcales bacterium]